MHRQNLTKEISVSYGSVVNKGMNVTSSSSKIGCDILADFGGEGVVTTLKAIYGMLLALSTGGSMSSSCCSSI